MKNAFIIIVALIMGMQLFQIDKTNPPIDKSLEIDTPAKIKSILKRACYDCHSNETKWPWYSSIAPMSWTINSHVNDGRAWVNFSIWKNYSEEEKTQKLKETYRAIYAAMPIGSYVYFHPKANLSMDERKVVRDWIRTITNK